MQATSNKFNRMNQQNATTLVSDVIYIIWRRAAIIISRATRLVAKNKRTFKVDDR